MRTKDFEVLFEAHGQSLFAFLVYRTGDRALAEDVLSDAFERALRARRRFDPEKGDARAWLYSIALNRLRDVKRRSAVEATVLAELGSNGNRESVGFEERVLAGAEVREALQTLPEPEREAVALRFGGDLTLAETARILDEPLSRVEGRIYRGLRKLRDHLDSERTVQ